MPYVSLPRPNTKLARPQVLALDHLERPQIDARRVIAAMGELGRASGMPGVDAGPFIEASGAQGHALGRALQDSGEVLTAIGVKQQQERDRTGMFRANDLLDAGGAEAAGYFANNPQKTHSWLGEALRIGGRVVKGLGEITGLSELGHQYVRTLGKEWHQGLLANTQAAVINQDLRNSADAQVGHVRGLLKQGDVRGAHAMLAPMAQSGVVEARVMRELEGEVRTMGAQQDEALALSRVTGPGLDLKGGHEAVAGSVYIPKERKPKLLARLTHVHAAASQEAYVLKEMEQDPGKAVKLLEDHGQVTLLSPRVREELRKMAVSRREAVGEEGYVRSREYVDLLEAEKLKVMTPEGLESAMSGGEHGREWKQAGVFHKALAEDYLALKQGKVKLDDPVRQLALEAAIDRYVPDMDEEWRAGQMRLMIREGFGEEKEGELMERLEARVRAKARAPAVTARAREELYQWAVQRRGAEGVNGEVDRETQVMSRMLDERAARGGKEGFKDEWEAVKFIKGEAGSLGWRMPGEGNAVEAAMAPSASHEAMKGTLVPVVLPMNGKGGASEGREQRSGPGQPGGTDVHVGGVRPVADVHVSSDPRQEAPRDPWSEMLKLQERQRKRGEDLRSQGEFSDHSNEENEQNYRDEEWLKQLELEEFGKKRGMSPQQVKTLQDDIDKATKNWADGWFKKADRVRILSDGRIVVNPRLWLSPNEYIEAVAKSGGSAEAQRRALAALRGLRAQASQRLYDAVIVLEPVKEFLDQQPGDVTHKIAALIEEQQRHPIWYKLSGQLGAGADEVAAAGIGMLAMASGQVARVEKLFGKGPVEAATRSLEQLAGHLTQRSVGIDQLSGLSKTDGLIDFTGHVVRMAPDLMAMEATGGLVRGGVQVTRYGKAVEAGSEAARALSAAGQTAGAGYFGARSGGATYLEALQAGLDTGKSLEEARADALAPALVTGVLSYATFSTGGTKGLTNIFRSEAATRALLEGGFKAFANEVGMAAGVGVMQMGLDSLAHDIVALHSYHPELTGEEILERALTSGLSGAAFAGFTRAVHGAAALRGPLGKAAVTKYGETRTKGPSKSSTPESVRVSQGMSELKDVKHPPDVAERADAGATELVVKWTPSPAFQMPVADKGKFIGEKGNSDFLVADDMAKAMKIKPGSIIPWREGIPDFGKYTVSGPGSMAGEFNVPGLTGHHQADREMMVMHMSKATGMSARAIKRWLKAAKVRLHHARGETVQIVPERVHQLHHSGGAQQIRGEFQSPD